MKCTVSLVDADEETIEGALYYQFEEGWVIFKDDEGKAVVSYPEKRVTRIKRIDETAGQNPNVVVVNTTNTRIAEDVLRRSSRDAAMGRGI